MARYIDVEGYRKLFDEEYKKTRELIFEGETHLDNLAEGFSEASRVIDSIPTADVVPKSEVTPREKIIRDVVSDVKKMIHSYARYPRSVGVDNYITLKVVDALLNDYVNKYSNSKE